MKKLLKRATSLLLMAALMVILVPSDTFACQAEWVPVFGSWNPYTITAWVLICGALILITWYCEDNSPPPPYPVRELVAPEHISACIDN